MIEFKFPESLDVPMFYSIDDVARLTQLAPRTVRRAINDGELVACQLRRQFRIPADALCAWAAASVVTPRPAIERPGAGPPRRMTTTSRSTTGRLRPLMDAR